MHTNQNSTFKTSSPEFDVSEIESLFSATLPKSSRTGGKSDDRRKSLGSKPDKVHLVILAILCMHA